MTETPNDPTPEEAAQEAVQQNEPVQPVQPQPGIGVETQTGTDEDPDTEPDDLDH